MGLLCDRISWLAHTTNMSSLLGSIGIGMWEERYFSERNLSFLQYCRGSDGPVRSELSRCL